MNTAEGWDRKFLRLLEHNESSAVSLSLAPLGRASEPIPSRQSLCSVDTITVPGSNTLDSFSMDRVAYCLLLDGSRPMRTQQVERRLGSGCKENIDKKVQLLVNAFILKGKLKWSCCDSSKIWTQYREMSSCCCVSLAPPPGQCVMAKLSSW